MTVTRLNPQTAPTRHPLRLDELVAEVLEDARFEHPAARIEYHAAGDTEVLGEPRGLRSAVENVLRNALDHTDPQRPVELELKRVGNEVRLHVLDCGPGVAENDLQRIFEPFFRSDRSRDHRHDGYGIGLAITARVLALHGGRVLARNRPTGGLEVVISIPAAQG
jgi:two-component system, OmpR family, sensor kinase